MLPAFVKSGVHAASRQMLPLQIRFLPRSPSSWGRREGRLSVPGVLHQLSGSLPKAEDAGPGPAWVHHASQTHVLRASAFSRSAYRSSESTAVSLIEITRLAVVIPCSGEGNILPKVFPITELSQKQVLPQESQGESSVYNQRFAGRLLRRPPG